MNLTGYHSSMNTDKLNSLADRLLEIPQQLSDLQLEILEKTQNSQEIANDLAEAEGALKVRIANEVDESGKKVYSNADARSAAFVELSADDEEIVSLNREQKEIQAEIGKLKIDFDCVSNEQRNIRSILHFFAGRVAEDL